MTKAKKKKSEPEPEVCAGCSKEITKDKPARAMTLGPGVEMQVHVSSRHTYSFGYSREPEFIKACEMRARHEHTYCQGCGKEQHGRTGVCSDCLGKLQRADEVETDVEWLLIDGGLLLPMQGTSETERELAGLFAKAISRGRIRHAFDDEVPRHGARMAKVPRAWGERHSGMVATEVSPGQAEAVVELYKSIGKLLHDCYQAGIEYGHRNILRLAQGEIGPEEFEGLKERAESNTYERE